MELEESVKDCPSCFTAVDGEARTCVCGHDFYALPTDHFTRDGRKIPIDDMFTEHLWATRAKFLQWLKNDPDCDQADDLRLSLKAIMAEIRHRTGHGRRRRRRKAA